MESRDSSAPGPLVGCTIQKNFKGYGKFKGEVKSYSAKHGWYFITYEDGDTEELYPEEVEKLLEKPESDLKSKRKRKQTALSPPSSGQGSKGSSMNASEVNNFTSDEVAADEKEDEDEEIATPAAKRSAHGKKNATAAPKTAKAKPVAKKDQKSKVDTVARKEATFADVDFALWAPEPATLPNPMPKPLVELSWHGQTIRTLELFAGCGGLHGDGFGTGPNGIKVATETIAAVEVEEAPALTYSKNYPKVNVLRMGVGRFLATARRLMNLKTPSTSKNMSSSGFKVSSMRIDFSEATQVWNRDDTGTTKRQDMDSVTIPELQGKEPLPWVMFKICCSGSSAEKWVCDGDYEDMESAVAEYLNSPQFTSAQFPLPGDIDMITGGPPCQGWSGYNVTRITERDLHSLMSHKENRLLGRFLEIIWVYKPMYVIMEEVPDVFAKANGAVMEWMKKAFSTKSYETNHITRLTTGLYGCPQTRDRLVLFAAMKGLKIPEIPKELHRKWGIDEAPVLKAFDSSQEAYPIEMKIKAPKGTRNPSALPELRGLVIGDAVSCDLPIEGMALRKMKTEEVVDIQHKYVCAPPTPFIAYLRQGADPDHLQNHLLYKLGDSDQLRCNMVPYRRDAGWRDMPETFANDLCYMKNPQAMVLTPEQYVDNSDTTSFHSRLIRKIPPFMLQDGPGARKNCEKGEIPELKHNWKLEPNRFALVPYWALTMKHCKDHDCYGRLWYSDVHPTVHSYHKPHWHRSLTPFAPRVMTVREKARIQGFPDKFIFYGTVEQQYKQIANAVSPQLTKSLMRSILSAHAVNCGMPSSTSSPTELKWSPSLMTFADFLKSFDTESILKTKRHTPQKIKPSDVPRLEPMTYTEVRFPIMSLIDILVEYNSQYRDDHSTRFAKLTPFEILAEVEDNHHWHYERFVGIRRLDSTGGRYKIQVCIKYTGFSIPEWYDLDSGMKRQYMYTALQEQCGEELLKKLESKAGVRARLHSDGKPEIMPWRHEDEASPEIKQEIEDFSAETFTLGAYIVQEGVDEQAAAGTTVPALARANEEFDKMTARYEMERSTELLPDPEAHLPKNKRGAAASRKARALAEMAGQAESAEGDSEDSGDDGEDEEV